MRGKKICFRLFLALALITAFQMYSRIDTEDFKEKIYLQNKPNKINKHLKSTALERMLVSEGLGGKLLTMFTTLADIPNGELTEKEKYRALTQHNFLQTTLFTSFKTNIQFVIYTNCSFWIDMIKEQYSHILILPLVLRDPFSTPLLKDMANTAMEFSDTPFYMFTNADDLYDTSLIQTINRVLTAIKWGNLRTKILVIGHRFNIVVREVIKNEDKINKLFEISEKSKPFAKDFAIITRDSFDWSVFPDLVVGRQFFDSYFVDFAFHNEIQMLDATDTIRLVHQEFKRGYSTAMNADKHDNEWNKKIFGGKISHSSILCSNFKTELSEKEILIFDKEKSKYLQNKESFSFIDEHRNILDKIEKCEKRENSTKIVSLTIIIITGNKPDSLSRLFQNINKSVYNNKRIDLIVNINIGLSGLYDIDTLKISHSFEWEHGHKYLFLNKQTNELKQIIELTKNKNKQFIILQDDVIVSRYFYKALSGAINTFEVSKMWQDGGIGGISLEPPITFPNLKSYHNLVGKYSESMLLSRPLKSRGFYPNPNVWKEFTDWVKEVAKNRTGALANTFAAKRKNKTDWIREMFSVWFSYFLELRNGTMGYLVHPKGAIGTWGYRGLNGGESFLGFSCDLKNVFVKTRIPVLNAENPEFRFSIQAPRIEIPEIEEN